MSEQEQQAEQPVAAEWTMPSMPSLPETPEWVMPLLRTIIGFIAPLVALYFLYKAGLWVYEFAMSQWVVGNPNEWVVIMRDGETVQAGRGLNCFKSPYDTVAKFPSEHVKVELTTNQVTQEMQGLEVTSMIEWAVDKNNPLKAYKNLNLASNSYETANGILKSMASAIVRSMISNSTIDYIIENRRELRDRVITEMSEVVTGWGVHLVTVEVLDVKICSGKLFKDMQTKFREDQLKKATLEKLAVKNTLYFKQLEKDVETEKRSHDSRKVNTSAQWVNKLSQDRREVNEFRQICAIQKKEKIRSWEKVLNDRKNKTTMQNQQIDFEIQKEKEYVDNKIVYEAENRLYNDQCDVTAKIALNEQIKKAEIQAENDRAIKQAEYTLLKEGFNDPVVAKIKLMEVIKTLYETCNLGDMRINHQTDEDPIMQIISNFTKIVQ